MTEIQILVIAVAFIVAGIAKGAVGIGLPPIAAVATPLPSTIPSTISAADSYRRVGLLDRRVIITSLAAGAPATVIGAVATRWINPAALLGANAGACGGDRKVEIWLCPAHHLVHR